VDAPSGGSVVEGIGDKVRDDLNDSHVVCPNGAELGTELDREIDPAVVGERGEQLLDLRTK
jgi:hypothetical protein